MSQNLTVGELKSRIADLPDNAPVCIKLHDEAEWQKDWRYQTRELANAYRANDDRFAQNTILLIEVGPFQY